MNCIDLKHHDFNRRDFIKLSTLMSLALTMPSCIRGINDKWGPILPTRILGKTDLNATMFTLGSGAAGKSMTENLLTSIVETAIEGGCRFFETARMYGRGQREVQLGQILMPKYRNEIILLSKSTAKDADSLNHDLETSLESLKTDYLDIYLLHAIISAEDVDIRLKNGVFDAMLKAKEQGMIRHIGFSGHSDPDAHIYLLNKNLPEIEVMMCPVNVVDPLRKSFILNVLPMAMKKNIGIIGMKVLGGGGLTGATIRWGEDIGQERESVIPELLSLKNALDYVWSLPVSTSTLGCTSVEQVKMDIAYLQEFLSISEVKRNALTKSLKEVAELYNLEHYKNK